MNRIKAFLLMVILFIVFTNPVSSHAVARAAHFVGIPMSDRSVKDALSEDGPAEDGPTNDEAKRREESS